MGIGGARGADERRAQRRAMMCSILYTADETGLSLTATLRRWTPLLAVLALLNVGAGLVLVTYPERGRDLRTMRHFTRDWLRGIDVYGVPDSVVDYPPHSIVVLSPLGTLQQRSAVPLWTALNVALAIAAPILAARFVLPRLPWRDVLVITSLSLCWSGSRSFLQFTLLCLVLGLGSAHLAERRPVWSGICLGLALMKPQVGAAWFALAVFRRQWNVAAIALATIAAGLLAFCWRVGSSPLQTATDYMRVLNSLYAGESMFVGVSHLKPLFARALGAEQGDLVAAVLALALIAAIGVEGLRFGATHGSRLYPAPSLVALWALLTFYHLTYGFVSLVPLLALLLLDPKPATKRLRLLIFVVMQLSFMIDAPGLWRRFGWKTETLVGLAISESHRIVLVGLFVAISILHYRSTRT